MEIRALLITYAIVILTVVMGYFFFQGAQVEDESPSVRRIVCPRFVDTTGTLGSPKAVPDSLLKDSLSQVSERPID